MKIIVDDLRGPEIAALLEAHLELMRSQSPPESVHALDLESLRAPEITFWTAWEGDDLLLTFELPSGTFATTVLHEIVEFRP